MVGRGGLKVSESHLWNPLPSNGEVWYRFVSRSLDSYRELEIQKHGAEVQILSGNGSFNAEIFHVKIYGGHMVLCGFFWNFALGGGGLGLRDR